MFTLGQNTITMVLTNDNIAIIVPNADFIANSVTNWSHGDPKIRLKVPYPQRDIHIHNHPVISPTASTGYVSHAVQFGM